MVEDKEATFGRMVLNRAWFAAWQFFESKTRDAIVFVALFAAGGVVYYRFYAWPATKEQVVPVLIFTVGPIVALWMLLFVWHLWLAPAAILYEKTRAQVRITSEPSAEAASRPTVNWTVWRQMEYWSLRQFAAILANSDPASTKGNTEVSAFYKIIKDDLTSGKLAYVRETLRNLYDSGFHEKSLDGDSKIKKVDAIRWADAHEGFDVSHVR